MIKEQAIDTLTLGNVSVTETDYCGGKVAVWPRTASTIGAICAERPKSPARMTTGTPTTRMHGSTAPTPRPGNAASLPRRKPTGTSTTASPMSSGM